MLPLLWCEGDRCWLDGHIARVRIVIDGYALVRFEGGALHGVLREVPVEELDLVLDRVAS